MLSSSYILHSSWCTRLTILLISSIPPRQQMARTHTVWNWNCSAVTMARCFSVPHTITITFSCYNVLHHRKRLSHLVTRIEWKWTGEERSQMFVLPMCKHPISIGIRARVRLHPERKQKSAKHHLRRDWIMGLSSVALNGERWLAKNECNINDIFARQWYVSELGLRQMETGKPLSLASVSVSSCSN